jgi:hypothetical protein
MRSLLYLTGRTLPPFPTEPEQELIENQLFRMKYIDPKIPGHRVDAERLGLANSAVNRIREALHKAKGLPVRNPLGKERSLAEG